MKYKLPGCLAGLLLALALMLTGCGADQSGPDVVARHYLENMRDAAYNSAYDLLTSDSQLKFSRSQYADRLEQARRSAGITRSEILRLQLPSLAGKRASVAYQLELTLQDGRRLTLSEAIVLLQQDNGWRVIWPPF